MIILRPPNKIAVARALSIIGHPFLFAPCAAVLAMFAGPQGQSMAWSAGVLLAVIVLAIGVYSWRQVRSGAWEHVDASRPRERNSLNRLALCVMLLAAVAAWFSPAARLASPGFALGAGLVAAGWVGLPRFKMSLHVAFAVFGAALLLPYGGGAVAAGCLLACAVAWSRLVLGRHTVVEVVLGVVGGAAAGLALWFLLNRLFGVEI